MGDIGSNTGNKQRRKERLKQGIWTLIAGLPHPWGAAAGNQYSDLSTWQGTNTPLDWASIPTKCDPCALLNGANRGKKHGKTVMEQIGLLEFEDPKDLPASLSNSNQRGMHKRWQVESILSVLRRLIDAEPLRAWNIVDFGCGTGSLLLPLACLFPTCRFTGVDMKPAALAILRQRAAACALTNVHTYLGMIEQFEDSLDIALALHACGNATDAAMLRAQQHRAAYIVSPCCVGKLKFSLAGGTSFGPTASGWRWMPRLRGSEQEVQVAGQWLRAAACGDELPVFDVTASCAPVRGHEEGQPIRRESGILDEASITATSAAAMGLAGSGEGKEEVPGRLEPKPTTQEPPSRQLILELRHPRSQALLRLLPEPQQNFKLLAQVADTNLSLEERRMASGTHAEALATVWSKLEKEERGHGQQRREREEPPEGAGSLGPHKQTQLRDPGIEEEEPAVTASTLDCAVSPAPEERLGCPDDGFETEVTRDAAQCALAKLHIEIDRNEQAREAGYAVGIMRMLHARSMAKGDLLVGFPAEAQVWSCLLPLMRTPDCERV